MKVILLAAALIMPPAETYYSWMSPEIADEIMSEVATGNYHAYLDYNGDGELTVSDAVCVAKRYNDNCANGNTYGLTTEKLREIIAENFVDCISWEICSTNGKPCRMYDLTVNEVTDAEIYVEFAENSETFTLEIDPYKELVSWKG